MSYETKPEILKSLIHQETNTGTLVAYKDDIIWWYSPPAGKQPGEAGKETDTAYLKDHIAREYNKRLHQYGLDSYIEVGQAIIPKVDAGLRPVTDESFLA